MQYIDVRFNLINDAKKRIEGILPKKAEELSTGYDVFNAGPDITFTPGSHYLIPLGFRAIIPCGWWLFLVPRSSTHAKKHMHTLYGVIDESYEGHWYFSSQWIPTNEQKNESLIIKHGDAVAQIIVMPRFEMYAVEVTDEDFTRITAERGAKRGAGGFGSTG